MDAGLLLIGAALANGPTSTTPDCLAGICLGAPSGPHGQPTAATVAGQPMRVTTEACEGKVSRVKAQFLFSRWSVAEWREAGTRAIADGSLSRAVMADTQHWLEQHAQVSAISVELDPAASAIAWTTSIVKTLQNDLGWSCKMGPVETVPGFFKCVKDTCDEGSCAIRTVHAAPDSEVSVVSVSTEQPLLRKQCDQKVRVQGL